MKEEEINKILQAQEEPAAFEEILDKGHSPLNQPVLEKDIAQVETAPGHSQEDNPWEPEAPVKGDAPEQQVEEAYEGTEQKEAPAVLPTAQANQAANSLLGMADNLIAVGGGMFVQIKKDESWYLFDEAIAAIDEQNEGNLQRIRLDEQDKALLRPIIAAILKKRAKNLTPEQQLLGALASIMVKKYKVAMEIRQENAILESRIQEIVQSALATNPNKEKANQAPGEDKGVVEPTAEPFEDGSETTNGAANGE